MIRALFPALAVVLCCVPAPGKAETVFPLDQRYGSIDFSVDHLGLLTSHGDFRRFSGSLTIDAEHPERTGIRVMIDAQSVDMDSSDGLTMVRSADYFDVDRHPVITFESGRVMAVNTDHYRIDGTIRIRDVARPLTLDAVLTGHPRGPSGPMSEFVVDGTLNRGEFGMVADRNFVSDTVHIHVTARIALDHAPKPPG
jgi:polyisoprenoid-binding protein YceI